MVLLQFCMAAALIQCFVVSAASVILHLLYSITFCLCSACGCWAESAEGVVFYEGTIKHVRRKPVHNAFTYPVRMALVNLDSPPDWWKGQAGQFMTAAAARELAGTTGDVKLLSNPVTAGYSQNPICIYYCHSEGGTLDKCIAEVTNTPWAAKVTFLFNPAGQSVPKALHVSPFMDMQNTWHLKADFPGKRLLVTVAASHREHGDYFLASLRMHVSDEPSARSERAGLIKLFRYGYQPQRDALLIYWQAMKLLWRGVPFYSPPSEDYKERLQSRASTPRLPNDDHFLWTPAKSFPWTLDQ